MTHLRTIKNKDVIVPNSVILTSQVVNYSSYAAGPGLILHTTVGIGYEVPWRYLFQLRHARDAQVRRYRSA